MGQVDDGRQMHTHQIQGAKIDRNTFGIYYLHLEDRAQVKVDGDDRGNVSTH